MKQDYENCTTYTYDAQGSLLSEQESDLCRKYLYNDFHQCIRTEVIRGREEEAERILQENRYDGEGLRFSLIENGKRTDFITNGWDNLAELDENGQVTKRIIRGMGIVASEDVADNIIDASAAFNGTAYHYYHGNERMDVESITDEAGKVVNGYTYDAFGTIVTSSEKLQNRYTYNGEAFDKTTEQYYLRKRFYNPKLSRFIQEDEYRGDGLNLYAFCANNPVMYVDPSGYAKKKCGTGSDESEEGKKTPAQRAAENGYPGIGTSENGGPDFRGTDYIYKTADGQEVVVTIKMTGNRQKDFNAANEAAGFTDYKWGKSAVEDYTWHHFDDYNPSTGTCTMQLVLTKAHQKTVPHIGSCAQYDSINGPTYNKK